MGRGFVFWHKKKKAADRGKAYPHGRRVYDSELGELFRYRQLCRLCHLTRDSSSLHPAELVIGLTSYQLVMSAEPKRCSTCFEIKPHDAENFPRDPNMVTELARRCRICARRVSLAWRISPSGRESGLRYYRSA